MADKRQMHLGLSIANLGYHYAAWRHPDVPADGNMRFQHYVDCVKIAERGKLDLIFLADSAASRDLDNPGIAREMEHQIVKHEPLALLAALSTVTTHVGLVATASVTYNDPYNLARALGTLDHLSHGRAGWNLVTGFSRHEAQNFGLEKVASSEERHRRAAEFMDVFTGLHDSWDDGAILRDKPSGMFYDRDHMHFLAHEGEHFRVRGPLDVPTSPQRQLPVFTAGGSDNAQELAARYADVVYGGQPELESAREYYASVKGRLAKYGRSPDDLKLLPGIMAFVGRTQQEAQDKFERMQALIEPKLGLGMLVTYGFPDYTGYDIDGPVPDLAVSTEKSFYPPNFHARMNTATMTIRQLYEAVSAGFWHFGVVGTPSSIADIMEEWFTTGAADGFNIQSPCIPVDSADFVDLVVPELQRRGLFRTEYTGTTLRDHLGLKPARSRYEQAKEQSRA